jgi:hypothetical protein
MSVEGANEFFANGILVHNCDAASLGYRMLKHAHVSVPTVQKRSEIEDALRGSMPDQRARPDTGWMRGAAENFFQ